MELKVAVTLFKFVEAKVGLLLQATKKAAKARKPIALIPNVFIGANDTAPK